MRQAIERAFGDWDTASTRHGMIPCRYTEAYADSLDTQGVDRTLVLPRELADERGIAPGTVIDWIHLRAGKRITGPLRVETYEPQSPLIVVVRLRDPGA